MKKTILILSAVLISALFGACAAKGLAKFPVDYLYVADVTNMVCVKYQIIDFEKLTVKRVSEERLIAKGPCDRMTGFERRDYLRAKNWIVDAIKDFKNKLAQPQIEQPKY